MSKYTNADLFMKTFNGMYATELWSLPEKDFLEWLNAPAADVEPRWIPVTERLPEIDNNLDGIRYLYPFLVTRYSSINTDRTKYDPYVSEHFFDGEDFLNLGGEVRSEYVIAWMPLPEPYKEGEQR